MFLNIALLFLLNSNNEVLLLRRINTLFANNCYSFPGGALNHGETAREAIAREAQESLGITLNVNDLSLLHVMHCKYDEPDFFVFIFTTKVWDGGLYNKDNARYDDMKWFPLNAFPKKSVPGHKEVIPFIKDALFYSKNSWSSYY